MARKTGRDRDESADRRDALVEGNSGTTARSPGTGLPGGRAGVDTESVDFDDMGDLGGGADDAIDLADATHVDVDSDELSDELETGPGMATTPALRISDEVTGGMGSDVGDQEGIGQGMDIDPEAARSEYPATGTSQRAGLGGRSSGQEVFDPAAGSNMANPADMGDQG